jgi:hypothetical protein
MLMRKANFQVLMLIALLAYSRPALSEAPLRASLAVTPSSNLPGLPAAFIITVSNDSDADQTLYGGVALNVTSATVSFRAAGSTPPAEVLNLPADQMDQACDGYCLTIPAHAQREVVIDFGPRLNGNPFFWDRRLEQPGAYVFSLGLSTVDASGEVAPIQTNTQPFTVESPAGVDLETWNYMKEKLGVEWGVDLDPRIPPRFFAELRSRFPTSRYSAWTAMYGSATLEFPELQAIDAALATNPPPILRDNLLLAKGGELTSESDDALRSERNGDKALLLAEQSKSVYSLLVDTAITARVRQYAKQALSRILTRATAEDLLRGYAQADPPAPDKVEPFVECISRTAKASFTARFGYSNPNASRKAVTLSNLNQVTPAPRDQGQPRVFAPGRHEHVFEASSPGGDLTWHLDGSRAVATAKFPVQCSEPVSAP